MATITISRGTFSGGKILADSLSRSLGYRSLDRDALVRKAATQRITEYDLLAALEEPPGYPGRLNHKRYIYLALLQAALWDEVRAGNLVYHGLAGHLLLKGAPGLLRLRIIAPMEVRIRMAQERLNVGRDEAADYIGRMDHDRRKWTQFLYGVDWESPSTYDLVINLERVTSEQACRLVVSMVEAGALNCTPECQSVLNDRALASRVRKELALDPYTLNLEVEVEARDGRISIRGDSLEDEREAIRRVAWAVPGVAGVAVNDVMASKPE